LQVSTSRRLAFLLAESSLFVFPHRILMLTCGRTDMHKALAQILHHIAHAADMQPSWVQLSHRALLAPAAQPLPHQTPDASLRCMRTLLPTAHETVLGASMRFPWYAFTAQLARVQVPPGIAVYMHGLPQRVCAAYTDPGGSKVYVRHDLHCRLPPGFVPLDTHCFEPHGYSANGGTMQRNGYWTVHVTPEPNATYASFEAGVEAKQHEALLRACLEHFCPRRACVVQHGVLVSEVCNSPVPEYELVEHEFRLLVGDVAVCGRWLAQRADPVRIEAGVPAEASARV
jgi:S-adenosylmethionine decarboxylase